MNHNNGDISLNGKIIVNVKDKDDFYSSFQIKKSLRKMIKEIQFDFIYSLEQKKIKFDNVKIDNKMNPDIDRFINNYNANEIKFLNKIRFKNFVNNFFDIYAG